jgi:hypothetical protein
MSVFDPYRPWLAPPGRKGGLLWIDNLEIGLPDKCWRWLGYKKPGGYIKLGNSTAHRAIYEFLNGSADGLHVHHICGNRSCVNPAHLRGIDAFTHMSDHQKEKYVGE